MFSGARYLNLVDFLLKNNQFGLYNSKLENDKLQGYCRHAGNLDNSDLRKIFSLERHAMEIFVLVSYVRLNESYKNDTVMINAETLLGY